MISEDGVHPLVMEPSLRVTLRRRALLCTIVFFALMVLAIVRSGAMDRLDRAFGREPQDLTEDSRTATRIWVWIGDVTGPQQMAIVAVLVAAALFVKGHPRLAVLVFVPMASNEYLTRALKTLVDRQRPVWNDPVETISGYSFPSGHSSGIAAAAGIAIVLSLVLTRRRWLRRAVAGVAVTIALIVGADRIFLGVHNLSDVIAGFTLGVVVVHVTLLSLSRLHPAPGAAQGPVPGTA
jgi:membrane-associated phospholipid phosphatase